MGRGTISRRQEQVEHEGEDDISGSMEPQGRRGDVVQEENEENEEKEEKQQDVPLSSTPARASSRADPQSTSPHVTTWSHPISILLSPRDKEAPPQ